MSRSAGEGEPWRGPRPVRGHRATPRTGGWAWTLPLGAQDDRRLPAAGRVLRKVRSDPLPQGTRPDVQAHRHDRGGREGRRGPAARSPPVGECKPAAVDTGTVTRPRKGRRPAPREGSQLSRVRSVHTKHQGRIRDSAGGCPGPGQTAPWWHYRAQRVPLWEQNALELGRRDGAL